MPVFSRFSFFELEAELSRPVKDIVNPANKFVYFRGK